MAMENASIDYDGTLSGKVMQFARIVERLVPKAKEPGFTEADWAPLTELVATEEFERVGIWREVMNWQQFIDFQMQFATSKGFETTLQRVTEVANTVFYEIEERHLTDGKVNVVDSMNVFEFNDEQKIRHMDIYVRGKVEPSIPFEAMHFRE